MLISFVRLASNKLLFPAILALFLGGFADANDELDKALDRTSVFQMSEINLIEAQLELERWKHSQIEELHRNGFASWLELRRHQYTIDTIQTRLKTAREFQAFLSNVKTKKLSVGGDQRFEFRERCSSPIKIFAPDSIRLIGWIEGQSTVESRKPDTGASAIKSAQEKLAKAQKRYDAANDSDSVAATWREKATLELTLVKRELEHIQAFDDVQEFSHNQPELSVSIIEIENVVTATHTDALNMATLTVKQAEAAASGHIKSAQIMLAREQRRADAVHRLHSQGHASEKELKIVDERLAKAKSQLNAFISTQKARNDSLEAASDSNELTVVASHDPVVQWPAIVFDDKEFAMHLVDLRHEFLNDIAIGESNRLKTEFLQQVLDRLKAAATQSNPDSQIGSVLNEGQLNEIESYEMDIEFAKARLAATIERQQILVHEENRFTQQTIALNDAAHRETATLESPSIETLGLLSQIHPTAVLASNGNPRPLTRFSYLEFGELGDAVRSTNSSFARSNLRFVKSPYSFKSLDLFNLTPVRSPLLVRDPGRSHSRRRSQPAGMNYFHTKLRQNSYQTLRMSGPPYSDAWPQKVFYGQYGYRAFGGAYTYPNGILRADWRSNLTPGQVPWYAPGSPANIRANQLYYRRDGIRYYRW